MDKKEKLRIWRESLDMMKAWRRGASAASLTGTGPVRHGQRAPVLGEESKGTLIVGCLRAYRRECKVESNEVL